MTSAERPDAGDPLVGSSLDGRYLIRDRIGAGGMGVVYRGRQVSVGRDVAIKVVHPSMLGDRNSARRFLREVSLAARLSSPHTVQVIDFGETPSGTLYLVMELLAGEGLDAELRRGSRLTPARVVELAIPITDALAAAHAASFVHRDLKPSNVFLAREPSGHERVKVLDFGIARGFGDSSLTGSGEVVGSPPYVAPEAIRGEPLDGRADQYSLGCMLFQLLAGRVPFLGSSVAETFRLHLHEPTPPMPAGTPPVLAAIIERLLGKTSAERYLDASAVRSALVAAQRDLGVAPGPAAPGTARPAAGEPAPTGDLEVSITAATEDTRNLRPTPTPTIRRGMNPIVLGAIVFAGALVVATIAWRVSRPTGSADLPAGTTDGATTASAVVPPMAPPDAADTSTGADAALVDAPAFDAPPTTDAAAAPIDARRSSAPIDARRSSSTPDARPTSSTTPPPDAAAAEVAPAVDAAPAPARRDAGIGFVLPK